MLKVGISFPCCSPEMPKSEKDSAVVKCCNILILIDKKCVARFGTLFSYDMLKNIYLRRIGGAIAALPLPLVAPEGTPFKKKRRLGLLALRGSTIGTTGGFFLRVKPPFYGPWCPPITPGVVFVST